MDLISARWRPLRQIRLANRSGSRSSSVKLDCAASVGSRAVRHGAWPSPADVHNLLGWTLRFALPKPVDRWNLNMKSLSRPRTVRPCDVTAARSRDSSPFGGQLHKRCAIREILCKTVKCFLLRRDSRARLDRCRGWIEREIRSSRGDRCVSETESFAFRP